MTSQSRNQSTDKNVKKHFAHWTSFYDGWFSYYYCSNCGKKAFEDKETCPNCGSTMHMFNT